MQTKKLGNVFHFIVRLPLVSVEHSWLRFGSILWNLFERTVEKPVLEWGVCDWCNTHMYSMVPQKVCVTEPSWIDSLQRPKSVSLMCPAQERQRRFKMSITPSQSILMIFMVNTQMRLIQNLMDRTVSVWFIISGWFDVLTILTWAAKILSFGI